jgi:hypothetical protein
LGELSQLRERLEALEAERGDVDDEAAPASAARQG